jgi:hypothetical protein
MDFGRAIGYGRDGKPAFWISDGAAMGPNREIHLAFEAADENAVRAFHDAAVETGRRVAARATPVARISPRLLRRIRARPGRQ